MRVLVYEHLSAGGLPGDLSLLREGAAMLRAVLDDLAACPGIVPVPVQARSQVAAFAHTCEAAVVIAPELDDILASFAYWFETVPCRLLGPDGDAVRLTADKLALADHLRRAGVPTPETRSLDGPHVVKPRFGCGCQDTFLTDPQAVVQPYVPGIAASVAFIDGVPLRAVRQHIRRESGRLAYEGGSLPLPADLEQRAIDLAARAVACVPGLAGFYGVDLVLGDRPLDDAVIEVNPRFTTSYIGLRALAETNLMAMLLGRDPSPPRWRGGRVSFTCDGTATLEPGP